MKIIDWKTFNSESFYMSDPSGAVIGVFDGLHKGHKHLLDRLDNKNLTEKIVFTFRKNPRYILNRQSYCGDIYTYKQKIAALKKAGVTTVVLIDFSGDFSKLSGKYFIACILKHLNLKKMSAGEDFKCGSGNDTNVRDLVRIFSERKIDLEIIKRIKHENITVSSSAIRKYIQSGNFQMAEMLLEYGYSIDFSSIEVHEDRDMFYAERKNTGQILPPEGRFAVSITINNITSLKDVIIDNKYISWYKTSG